MLEREVDIMADFRICAHQFKQFLLESEWVAIMKSDPFNAIDFGQGLDKFHDMRFAIDIIAIISKVLGYEYEFFNAFFREQAGFIEKERHWHRLMVATDKRDGAEGATAVTALRYFQIGVV